MKDILITRKRINIELLILLLAYIIANLINIYAVWSYGTTWMELITFQPMIWAITLLMYALSVMGRGIYFLIIRGLSFVGRKR